MPTIGKMIPTLLLSREIFANSPARIKGHFQAIKPVESNLLSAIISKLASIVKKRRLRFNKMKGFAFQKKISHQNLYILNILISVNIVVPHLIKSLL